MLYYLFFTSYFLRFFHSRNYYNYYVSYFVCRCDITKQTCITSSLSSPSKSKVICSIIPVRVIHEKDELDRYYINSTQIEFFIFTTQQAYLLLNTPCQIFVFSSRNVPLHSFNSFFCTIIQI